MWISKQNAQTLLSWFLRYEGETEADSLDWALAVQLKHAADWPLESIKRAEESLIEALRIEAKREEF